MKLAALVLGAAMALGSAAHADPYAQRAPLKQLLLQRFDRNHDGRLEPRERHRAAKALRRLARKLDRADRRAARAGVRGAMIERYDLDGDGNVGPGEMPPAMARRMRHLDRDGNGWIDPNESR